MHKYLHLLHALVNMYCTCVKTGTEIKYILCPMTNTAEAPTITTTPTQSLHYPPPPTKIVRTQLCSTLQYKWDGTIIIMTINSLWDHINALHIMWSCATHQPETPQLFQWDHQQHVLAAPSQWQLEWRRRYQGPPPAAWTLMSSRHLTFVLPMNWWAVNLAESSLGHFHSREAWRLTRPELHPACSGRGQPDVEFRKIH